MNKKAVELEYDDIIDSLTPHIFRHNYATLLDKAGVPLKEQQYLMGHANVTMTMNTYTHVDAAHLRATELLNNYVPKRLS
ncbi:MAG: tyrosine-type recombinase/integrase [Erysipelotrichaceae bacterium]|nr:tyrosine-type recombinase/integrase [Erysipelotrichaceae bacterium]